MLIETSFMDYMEYIQCCAKPGTTVAVGQPLLRCETCGHLYCPAIDPHQHSKETP